MAVPVYALDLYPRDDPRDGTLIRTLTPQKAGWRDEANSTGSGFVEVRSTSDDGQAFNPLGLDYVRVRDVANGDRIVGGFFNDKARVKLLTKTSSKLLRVEGAGPLSYTARAAMAPHTYLDIAIGQDPIGGVWHLSQQGPAVGGNLLGSMLWRVVYEAQHYRVALTQHRHADGLIYTDSHADDRAASDVGIPDLVLGFDQFEDSDGNPWTLPSGEFKAQVGESLLAVIKRLMEAGLYVEMDPDTFELRAWEGTDHRRDLTAGAWAADKVRLQSPTDGTTATGNILSDADREVAAHVKRRTLYVGQAGSYVKVTGPTDIPWEGGVNVDVEDPDALEQIGETQLQARSDAGDTLKVRLKPGDDPTVGTYRAWEHVRPDDLITVHSGADQWEYDEQDFPVAAISINLREGGDWDTWLELGSSFAAADRRFSVAPVAAHNHALPFCPPEQPAVAASCSLDPSQMEEFPTPNGDFEDGDANQWNGAVYSTVGPQAGVGCSGVNTLTPQWRYHGWLGETFEAGTAYVFRFWILGSGAYRVRIGDVADDGSSVSGDYEELQGSAAPLASGDWQQLCIEWTPSADRTAVRLVHDKNGAHGELGIDSLQAYSGGLAQNEGNGVSGLIARCDHTHPGEVIDHGELDGLEDDDHPQYQTEAEVDAQIAAAIATVTAGDLSTRWTPVTTWNGDHWIMVTDGSGTPVLTEVS